MWHAVCLAAAAAAGLLSSGAAAHESSVAAGPHAFAGDKRAAASGGAYFAAAAGSDFRPHTQPVLHGHAYPPAFTDEAPTATSDFTTSTPSPTADETTPDEAAIEGMVRGGLLLIAGIFTASGTVATLFGLCTRDASHKGYQSITNSPGEGLTRAGGRRLRTRSAGALLLGAEGKVLHYATINGVTYETRPRSFGSAPNLTAIIEAANSDADDDSEYGDSGGGDGGDALCAIEAGFPPPWDRRAAAA
ncbi:hypothetical protein JKP88DRAFT_323150 [Tribonema minus]|uniref:Uncharacterized protein n=1 Tax=Tribonema minus TaxID=303371 RepID=A0A835YSK1_9STRA|nr:hypothetical protein JKP88DRAFT_323150 [Tribonema minus]